MPHRDAEIQRHRSVILLTMFASSVTIEAHMSSIRRIVAIALIPLVVACGNSEPTAPDIDGQYTLQRVNGAVLPGILDATATDTVRAIGGFAVIRGDGTWAGELNLMITSGGFVFPTTDNGSGTYTRDGDTIQFREARDGSVVVATVNDGTLVMSVDGDMLEFHRR